MNILIKYFYPDKEVNYFDSLKTKFFIIQGYIGVLVFAIYIIPDILNPGENFLFSFTSKFVGVVIHIISLFILKKYGISKVGNIYSLTLIIMISVSVNILADSISPIYKHIQGYYSFLGIYAAGVMYASRKIMIINFLIVLATTTRVYFYAIEHFPNEADFFTTGYSTHTVAIVLMLTVFFFLSKFTDKAIAKANDEADNAAHKNMELATSEEEIRATNEELMATTDALRDSNNELYEALKSIEESKAKFKQLSDLTFEGILTHHNGIVIDANLSFMKMSGYTREDLICKNIIDLLVPKQYHTEVANNLKKEYVPPYEITGMRKDGTIMPIEIESKIIDKKTETRVIAVRDITERKKHEKELVLAKEKAEESDRLKVEFLNNMSHEIRTPMNGIVGFTQLLDTPDLTEESRKSYTKIITSSSNQLLNIIENIIEISKLGTKQVKIKTTDVNIHRIMLDISLAFNDEALNNNISFTVKDEISDVNSIITTDEPKLNRILSTLIDNAIKFTPNGSVEFGYEVIIDEDIPSKKAVKFYIKDTGIGIEKDKQELIFNRFSQAEPKLSRDYGGLGLGLAIAKENVILIGGSIRLESEIGKGSTFFVTIPLK